jgi:hypothetical protein
VIQSGNGSRLPLEPLLPRGVGGHLFRQNLIATSRPSRVSRARYTSPMPPAPSLARIS